MRQNAFKGTRKKKKKHKISCNQTVSNNEESEAKNKETKKAGTKEDLGR